VSDVCEAANVQPNSSATGRSNSSRTPHKRSTGRNVRVARRSRRPRSPRWRQNWPTEKRRLPARTEWSRRSRPSMWR